MPSAKRTLAIVREVYSKWERRAPLTPEHVARILASSKNARVLVQPSKKRVFADREYEAAGATLQEDISEANVVLAVKQIAPDKLVQGSTSLFFSHTIKAQPENMRLLDAVLAKNVTLIDYECIRNNHGERLVAFGEFAGRAGMIDALRGLGIRLLGMGTSSPFLNIAPTYAYTGLAHAVGDVAQAGELYKQNGGSPAFLPPGSGPLCFVFTGDGKVSKGAQEVFRALNPVMVGVRDLPSRLKEPDAASKIFGVVVRASDVCVDQSGLFNRAEYNTHPENYASDAFARDVLPHATAVVTGAYWDARFPRWLPNEKLFNNPKLNNLLVIADLSCDINGSVECLHRSTTIDDPFMYVDAGKPGVPEITSRPLTQQLESDPNCKLVLGVDILPSELPRDATRHFGDCLMPFVSGLLDNKLPFEMEDAAITRAGRLTPRYRYIDEIRRTRERSHDLAAAKKDSNAFVVRLVGHLFDSKVINRALDLIESLGGSFQIVQAFVTNPRGGAEKYRSTSTVLLRIEAPLAQLEGETEAPIKVLKRRLSTLVNETPPEAETSMYEVSSEELDALKSFDNVGVTTSTVSQQRHELWKAGEKNTRGKRFVVFGAGSVAAPAIEYLSSRPEDQVLVVSGDAKELARVVSSTKPNVKVLQADLSKLSASSSRSYDMKDFDAAVSLLPQFLHNKVFEECLEARIPLVTASYASSLDANLMRRAEGEANIEVLCEMGLDPGIDHMEARRMIEEIEAMENLEQITSFESYCGGLAVPDAASNPIGYRVTWSPKGALTALLNPAKYLLDSRVIDVPGGGSALMSLAKPFHLQGFVYPGLRLEEYPNRDATKYVEAYGLKRADLDRMYRATLRYRGFAETMKEFIRAGFLQSEPVEFTEGLFAKGSRAEAMARLLFPVGTKVSMDVLAEAFKSELTIRPEERDLIVMEHRVRYKLKTEPRLCESVSTMVLSGRPNSTAMSQTVGLTAAAGARALTAEGWRRGAPGLILPTDPRVYSRALPELAQQGIGFTHHHRSV